MYKIRTLLLKYNISPINNEKVDLDSFRKFFISHFPNNPIFHNHIDKKFIYKYPLIQYKNINNFFYILAINEGADSLLDIIESKKLPQHSKDFIINEKPTFKMSVKNLNIVNVSIPYKLENWFALNESNYSTYKNTPSIIQRCQLLENILKANILSFAKSIKWKIDQPINLFIHSVQKSNIQKFKSIDITTFDLIFFANIILPDYIGLGKSASKNFGTIKKISPQSLKKLSNYDL
jgi:hypothetical protein